MEILMAADIWDSSSERQVFIYIILSYASGSLNKLAGDIAYVTEERVLSGCAASITIVWTWTRM